ncbi:MAG: DUF427 domain-containing protein [Spirulinaceae cyanobacterium RM2_2_10]|nr:DUF427 domain-containing protein [Spirulinaceae cyanobacterium SM2_1_0]NJO20008.1 DUF427 domain-containing protein [Spirulinaceae cyanobacterium RM2_2_10]
MPKATVNGTVVAASDQCERVEGNYYFPPSAIAQDYFTPSSTHTSCPWKGQASYYNLVVNGQEIKDAAWTYPQAKERAKNIEGYVAFYRNKVQIED